MHLDDAEADLIAESLSESSSRMQFLGGRLRFELLIVIQKII